VERCGFDRDKGDWSEGGELARRVVAWDRVYITVDDDRRFFEDEEVASFTQLRSGELSTSSSSSSLFYEY